MLQERNNWRNRVNLCKQGELYKKASRSIDSVLWPCATNFCYFAPCNSSIGKHLIDLMHHPILIVALWPYIANLFLLWSAKNNGNHVVDLIHDSILKLCKVWLVKDVKIVKSSCRWESTVNDGAAIMKQIWIAELHTRDPDFLWG